VLGLGYSARLNQQVRIARGLSYGIGSELELHPDASLLVAQGQTDHRNVAQVLQLVREELRRLGDAAPAAQELQARQATLVGNLARRLETVGTLNRLIVDHLAQGQALDALMEQVDHIRSVRAEQVREFAATQWPASRQRAVVAGEAARDGAKSEPDLQALRVLPGALDLDRVELVRPRR
jgi:zinc protease